MGRRKALRILNWIVPMGSPLRREPSLSALFYDIDNGFNRPNDKWSATFNSLNLTHATKGSATTSRATRSATYGFRADEGGAAGGAAGGAGGAPPPRAAAPEPAYDAPALFAPAEIVSELIGALREVECPICFEDMAVDTDRTPEALHSGDHPHPVCNTCRPRMGDICPLCRMPIDA